MSIPKIIHYCWFGRGQMNAKAKKCLGSWKGYWPDYEIIEWNEDNFDLNMNAYTRTTYANRQYAFLSDYVRLLVVQKYGGIYLDTDVELVRTLDPLLHAHAYFGFENNEYVNTGVGFGAEAGAPVLAAMLAEYEPLLDGEHGVIGCPKLNTAALVKLGLQLDGKKQEVAGATIYPADYFNPYDDPTGRLNCTENTYSIHWYAKNWLSKRAIIRSKLTRPFHRIFGVNCFRRLKR